MDTKQAIMAVMTQADAVVQAYLGDFGPGDMMARAVPGLNHVAWQLGHLITSETYLVSGCMPKGATFGGSGVLPAGFVEKHGKGTVGVDDPKAFLSKEEYLRIAKAVRAETVKFVEGCSAGDWERPVTGMPPFCKTVGATLVLVGGHWLMHTGQWVAVRRKLGKPVVI